MRLQSILMAAGIGVVAAGNDVCDEDTYNAILQGAAGSAALCAKDVAQTKGGSLDLTHLPSQDDIKIFCKMPTCVAYAKVVYALPLPACKYPGAAIDLKNDYFGVMVKACNGTTSVPTVNVITTESPSTNATISVTPTPTNTTKAPTSKLSTPVPTSEGLTMFSSTLLASTLAAIIAAIAF